MISLSSSCSNLDWIFGNQLNIGFPSPMSALKCWILLCGLLVTWAEPIKSELSFVMSQNGMDQLSNYSVKQGMEMLGNLEPMGIKIHSKPDPQLSPIGRVRIANLIKLRNLRLILEKDSMGVLIQDLNISSEANLSAVIWPFPAWAFMSHLGEERIKFNLSLPQTYLGIATTNSDLEPANNKFWLKSCTVAEPKVKTEATNYWLVDTGLGFGGKWLANNIGSMMCGQVSGVINAVRSLLKSSIPIHAMLGGLVPELAKQKVTLHYNLDQLVLTQGRLRAAVAVWWEAVEEPPAIDYDFLSPDENGTSSLFGPGPPPPNPPPLGVNKSEVQLEIGAKGENHVTLWLEPSLTNSFLPYVPWDFKVMTDKVPVDSPKIAERSRKFLSVMCKDCFFVLNAWVFRAPVIIAREGSMLALLYVKVRLTVSNPRTNETSVFSSFFSRFDVSVVPFFEKGRLKVKIDLVDVNVNMTDAAFPKEWDFFVKDLIQGLILSDIWPSMGEPIDLDFHLKGIPLSPQCGFDPQSAKIMLTKGKLGISANMKLFSFDMKKCYSNLRDYMCVGNECAMCKMMCDMLP